MSSAVKSAPTRWIGWIVEQLPAPFRVGKMPYAVLFALMVIVITLMYAGISPYEHAKGMFLSLAGLIACLLVGVYFGMPLSWGVHIGTAAGALLLLVAVWGAGGIFSPRLAWLLVLPLTPFYTIGRRAGLFWLGVVLLIQLAMGLFTYLDWIPHFELGSAHVLSSTVTFSIVTGVLMIVPLIYDQLHQRTLKKTLRHQQELEAKRVELEHTLHMREVFIATVSHELRTPMNAILGFNALLLARAQDRPEALKVLNHTRQSADHLMTVINDILDYSQLQAGQLQIHPETFDLHELLHHAFELFVPRVRSSRLDYRIELDPDLPRWVHSDRHRIMQVLVNLLGNALKFTHQGSVVLRVQWLHPGVLLSVQDTGIGIPPDRQSRIFSRFSQADGDIQSRYGGNGLGLAISRQLVQLLGGTIGFESQPGQGTRFWFSLPLDACEAPVNNIRQTRPELQTAEVAWRFLIVDDHPVNRLLARQVLAQAWPQAEIHEAVHGQAALELLERQTVDLVLMDMVMPVMDGIEATRLIREQPRWQHLPVLGLTANVNPADLQDFREAGLSEVLLKPFEPGPLTLKVEHWLLQHG
ncbi:MAG: ATP-binding protein [Limnohabitans sp.]